MWMAGRRTDLADHGSHRDPQSQHLAQDLVGILGRRAASTWSSSSPRAASQTLKAFVSSLRLSTMFRSMLTINNVVVSHRLRIVPVQLLCALVAPSVLSQLSLSTAVVTRRSRARSQYIYTFSTLQKCEKGRARAGNGGVNA